MRMTISILILAGLPIVGLGQESGPASQAEAAVFNHPVRIRDSLQLQAVSARLREVRVLRADFEQEKQIKVLRRPLYSKGIFLFAADKGIFWETREPFANVFIMTVEAIFQRSGDAAPMRIDADAHPMVRGFTEVFLGLFSGHTEAIEEKFDLYFSGDSEKWVIGLQPKGVILKKLIARIVLTGSATIDSVLIREPSTDWTRIQFSQVSLAPAELSARESAYFEI